MAEHGGWKCFRDFVAKYQGGSHDLWNGHMNYYLALAASIAFLTGIVHSTMGELLIFRRLRRKNNSVDGQNSGLPIAHQRIIWASWHMVSVFGWGFGAVLLWLSFSSENSKATEFVEYTIIISMFIASMLVLFGTKGKHPGWIALLAISVILTFNLF